MQCDVGKMNGGYAWVNCVCGGRWFEVARKVCDAGGVIPWLRKCVPSVERVGSRARATVRCLTCFGLLSLALARALSLPRLPMPRGRCHGTCK